MLESVSERLMDTVHAGSPTKHPARRLETIEAAGRLRIPFTSGILVGIGETEQERIASLEALAEVNARHGHIQEVILQNFVPHPRYYGREVAEIADEAARERWGDEGPAAPSTADATSQGGGATSQGGGQRRKVARDEVPEQASDPAGRSASQPDDTGGEAEDVVGVIPEWANPITLDDMKLLVRECRRLMPEVGIQIPPNLADWWDELVEEGATDLGGLSANGDHISPEHAFPSPHQVRKRLQPPVTR